MCRFTLGLFLFTSIWLSACEVGSQLQPVGPTAIGALTARFQVVNR